MDTNYSENLFQSIDTIISQRLNEVSFDKTEVCKIVSQDENDKKKYQVTNDVITFEAYASENSVTYFKNQQVYVTIPQGNYELKKIILGRYNDEEITEALYTNPFDYLVYNNKVTFGDLVEIQVDNNSSNESEIKTSTKFTHKPGTKFDYLGLEFSLNTMDLMGTYKGTYFIEVQLFDNNTNQLNTIPLILLSSDLYGNPYALNDNIKFQHLFPFMEDIDITKVKNIKIIFGADDKFETSGSIALSNIALYFGYNEETVKDSKFQKLELIYPDSENEANMHYEFNATGQKRTLYLNWVFEDNESKPIIYNNEQTPSFSEEYKIYWLQYVTGSGDNGKGLPNSFNWKVIDENNTFEKEVNLNTSGYSDQYKAIIKYKDKYYHSNIIVFEVEDEDKAEVSKIVANSTDQLKLTLSDSGVYNIYGLDGEAIVGDVSKKRTITVEFLDGSKPEDIESIVWGGVVSYQNGTYALKPTSMLKSFKAIAATENTFPQAEYEIKYTYLADALDNTIECEVTMKNGQKRKGSITLQFGEAQTAGSNYALNIDFIEGNCVYPTGSGDEWPNIIEVKATFTKSNGEPVNNQPEIKWSWVFGDKIVDGENSFILPDGFNRVDSQGITDICKIEYISNTVLENNNAVLKATIENYGLDNGLTTNLITYLPIPVAQKGYKKITGATRVVYGMFGGITYSEAPYTIQDTDETVFWNLNTPNENGVPTLYISETGESKLTPAYLPPEELLPISINGYIENKGCIWSQPILILSDKWGSQEINEWNGSVKVGEDAVLSPLMIAGTKNGDGSFTGVTLGTIDNKTGIYGFQESIPRFSFTEDGEMYIGTDDNNHIQFTDDGKLDIKAEAFTINTNKFSLISDELSITDNEGIKLGNKILLEPDGTAKIGGWEITSDSLVNRNTDGTAKIIISGTGIQSGSYAAGSSGNRSDWTIWANKNFGVTSSGAMYAASGNIGGWDITSNGIESYTTINGSNKLYWVSMWSKYPTWGHFLLCRSYNDGVKGSSNYTDYFDLRADGTLYARNAHIEGTLEAGSVIIANKDNNNIQTKFGSLQFSEGGVTQSVYGPAFYIKDNNITERISFSTTSLGGSAYPNGQLDLYVGSSAGRSRIQMTGAGAEISGTWKSEDGSWSVTSDQNKKNSIINLTDSYSILFDNLIPRLYKYNDGTSDRYHTGFIAQEVQSALDIATIDSKDFAGLVIFDRNTENELWSLRYEEFIALNTWQIQKLKTRVTELEQEIKEIKQHYEI